MATDRRTVDHLLDVLGGVGDVTARQMFGEYALYLDGVVVGYVCDDQLFVKPTPGARAVLAGAELAPPYPGAKDYLLAGDALDDLPLMARALRAVQADAPPPKPPKPRKAARAPKAQT